MGIPSVMNNLPPLGKATAAFDEDVDGDGEVDEDAGDDQYEERGARTQSPVTCTMCQTYSHICSFHIYIIPGLLVEVYGPSGP